MRTSPAPGGLEWLSAHARGTLSSYRTYSAFRWGVWIAGSLAAWVIAAAALPSGLPVGIVLLGAVLGGLTALTAMGIVLVYRSARIINFAQGDIGGLAAALAVILVTGSHLPYFVALPIGLAAAVGTGAAIDAVVIRRFEKAPRLILTVATIGIAQILGAGELGLPSIFAHLSPITTFTTPFRFRFTVGPVIVNGNHVVALCVVPLVLAGLWWFFGRTDTGIAVRGAADSPDRARLLGIPVRRLSRVVWMVAAGLSGLAALLTAPILGPNLGVVAGPPSLLAPLAAAVVAGMDNLPVTVGVSVAIGVFQQGVYWSYPRSSTVDVALFVLILVGLLAQKRRQARSDDQGLGGFIAIREVRPIPGLLAQVPLVRNARWGAAAALAGLVVFGPIAASNSRLVLFSDMAIYGILAVSLVVLAGWAGQISLGQFAFAGIGAGVTGSLLVHAHADFFLALLAAMVVGAVAAVMVGFPTIRIPGLFLSVATMAFAVPVSSWLLNSAYFPLLSPSLVPRPSLFGRLGLSSHLGFYELCLVMLGLGLLLARNFRHSRIGRAVVAVRDNERGAAAFAVEPRRAKLSAYALSGALAGLAGGLLVVSQRGIGFSGYNPENSIEVFTMVVVGGLGSLPGALLGAIYVEWATYFLHGWLQLMATGAGLLVLLMVVPGGLGEVVYTLRDRILSSIARSRGIAAPSLAATRAFEEEVEPTGDGAGEVDGQAEPTRPLPVLTGDTVVVSPPAAPTVASIECRGIDASYGMMQVLFGVDLRVEEGEILALLGTNGAGKSTLLKVMSGLLGADAGSVSFSGRDITRLAPEARVAAGMAMMPGGRGVFPSLTVRENFRLAGWTRRKERSSFTGELEELLRLFPQLSRRLSTLAGDLSGGEQQMLALAQAFLCRPTLLLIDELSLGLAPSVVGELLELVRHIAASGTTVVVVEQSLNVAASVAERAVFLERGQVRFSGRLSDLVARPDLARAVFLRSAASVRTVEDDDLPPALEPLPDSNGSTIALEVRGARLSFGGVAALAGVDITARPGEVLGIIGANGAGKTTLFDLCSGYVPGADGRILLHGRDISSLKASERSALGLGRMFQDARLFPSLTVAEAVAVALDRHVGVREPLAGVLGLGASLDSEEEVRAQVDELLGWLGLERYRDAFVSELSTGTRRIVEIAGVLAHRPTVLLLDEPSSGIAQREGEALAGLLSDIHSLTGATLVVIEHDIPLVSSLADRMVCMHLGQVIAVGRPDQVLEDREVIAAYLGSDQAAIARSG